MSTAMPETPATPAPQATPTFVAPPAPIPGPPPVAAAPAPAPPAAPPTTPQGNVEDLPEWAQNIIYKGRDEAAKTRIESREKADQAAAAAKLDFAKALATAAGITLPGAEVDPQKLAADLSARENELRGLRTEVALRDAAATHKADLGMLLPFLKGTGALDKLDPAASDFAATLDALVKTTVDGNPKLQAGRAPGASGVDMTGGSGGEAQITEDQLPGMTAEQIVDAQNKGLLVNLGVGKPKS